MFSLHLSFKSLIIVMIKITQHIARQNSNCKLKYFGVHMFIFNILSMFSPHRPSSMMQNEKISLWFLTLLFTTFNHNTFTYICVSEMEIRVVFRNRSMPTPLFPSGFLNEGRCGLGFLVSNAIFL